MSNLEIETLLSLSDENLVSLMKNEGIQRFESLLESSSLNVII